MISNKGAVLGLALTAFLCFGSLSAQQPRPGALATTLEAPQGFGTVDYNVTTVSALAFMPESNGQPWGTSGSLGRIVSCCGIRNFYASIDLPPGVAIDYIGLNSLTDAPFVLGAGLIIRGPGGAFSTIVSIDSTVHGWATEWNSSPRGYVWRNLGNTLLLHVQGNSQANSQFFGSVEIWWRRTVSLAPSSATFTDVPVGHPQHRFVEALFDAGITAGCGGSNFCPDAALTRGQMAVFLAVALGLHGG